jgi:putative ABC transport system ATP-binding protein
MPEDPALLELRHISRRHPDGRQWLLHEISLVVRPGERVALVGPSGSGKTLLLRAMVLLDPLDQGEVLWRGGKLGAENIPRFRRQASYLQQRPSLRAESVEAALRQPYALKVYQDRGFDRQRALELLDSLGRSAEFLDKQPRDLSGGERQIAALVRVLQLESTLLLLDEPTAALDANTAAAAEQMLRRWSEGAPERALVWVTHDLAQARRVAERMLVMEDGEIQP